MNTITIWLLLSLGVGQNAQRIVSVEKFSSALACEQAKASMENVLKREVSNYAGSIKLTCMKMEGVAK